MKLGLCVDDDDDDDDDDRINQSTFYVRIASRNRRLAKWAAFKLFMYIGCFGSYTCM